MISRIHQRLGTAGFIISIVALVAALAGGAYAASSGLTGKQKNEVTAIAKKYAGKNGKNGAPGPQGATGPTGAKGDKGDPGTNGSNGSNGKNGESVTVESYAGPECENAEGEEGAKFSNSTGIAYACNGASASAGGGGLPKTLGLGETETGAWSSEWFNTEAFVPISFLVPLAAELVGSHTVVVAEGATAPTECSDGVAPAASAEHPEAQSGYLCVFVGGVQVNPSETHFEISKPYNGSPGGFLGAGTTGATLKVEEELGTKDRAFGTWAVTG